MSNKVADLLLQWYDTHGRHDLPWQQNRNAYTVWVSEIMLQQTQVKTVIPYYQKFIQRFPTVSALAESSIDAVLEHWSGLGYYARGRNLHKAAQVVMEEHQGVFPSNFDDLHALPGVGRSTAGAIMAQAYKQPYAILDGNVKRVLARLHCVSGWPGKAKIADALWVFAEQHTPKERVDDYTQAIMDLGATLCKRSKPDCKQCPLVEQCQAAQKQVTADYPGKKPKKILPVKTVQMLLLSNQEEEVLLEKRPPTGIWGGLYSLPEVDSEHDCEDWWQTSEYTALGTLEIQAVCPHIRHTFSHYHLDITPVIARLNGGSASAVQDKAIKWHNTEEDAGMPAPVKKLLKLLDSNQQQERLL